MKSINEQIDKKRLVDFTIKIVKITRTIGNFITGCKEKFIKQQMER